MRLTGLMLVLVLTACSSPLIIQFPPAPAISSKTAIDEAEGANWWRLRFRMQWGKGEALRFYVDPLIAHQLILPLLNEFDEDIGLWRFHRRAALDGAGHQFSFIFYSTSETADRIKQRLAENPLKNWLIEQDLIELVLEPKTQSSLPSDIELTSDKNWTKPVQRSWPYFILGVSQSWLMLIHELSLQTPLEGRSSYRLLLQYYEDINHQLTERWQNEGAHAYLHHLNAIFGYEPLKIPYGEHWRNF